jgi:hypothetical protein
VSLRITIGEIRLLQQEISSLTQRRKDLFSHCGCSLEKWKPLAKAIQLRAPT